MARKMGSMDSEGAMRAPQGLNAAPQVMAAGPRHGLH
jgi:hypothetical protein